jgi:drug/metabolite transporter, DME family
VDRFRRGLGSVRRRKQFVTYPFFAAAFILAWVNRSISSSPASLLSLSPALAGMCCCVVAAIGYTVSNVCMRQLSALHCDPTWATFNRELVTVLVVGPWLLAEALRGRRILPPWPICCTLILVGLAVELGGNLGVQWAYGKIGLATTIPAVFGTMLTASAVLGWALLGETVSLRSAGAIGLLLVALLSLGLGAGAASQSMARSAAVAPGSLATALAVGAACLAGIIYATFSVTVRHAMSGATRLSLLMVIITGTGVLSLGPVSLYRLGTAHLLATPAEHLAWMFAAGAANLIAFMAISKGLQVTTVVRANMLNASQVAMSALAGVALFGEPPNPWLIAGVIITSLGIVLIDRPVDGEI